jgi:hypothetical protein
LKERTKREQYKKIGRPSEKEFNDILQNNLICNCPVTSDNAKRALKIYGPDVATLKGKTVKKQNRGIPNYQAVQIPAPVIAQYNNVRLFVDIFWVNKSPYFHTILEWIKFCTVSAISNRYKRTLLMETKAVTNMYETRGFNVTRIEGNRAFACISNDVLPIPMNIADAVDHVAEVEQSIRTIKERTMCLVQGLPYKRIPNVMIRAAIENANKVMNQFLAQNGVSATLSPLTIMTGKPTPDYNDMKIEFGAYAQVFEENQITNTPITRTTGAIALTPTGNAQGGQFFMSLTTGRKLSRQQWDELPMPDGVIATVERMTQNENQPLLGRGSPLFEWSPGITIEDDEDIHIVQDDDDHIEVTDGEIQDANAMFPPYEPGIDGHMTEKEEDESVIEDEDDVDNENNERQRSEDNDSSIDDEKKTHEGQRSEHNGRPFDEENNEEQRSEHGGSSFYDEIGDNNIETESEETQIETVEPNNEATDDQDVAHGDPRTEGQTRHNLSPNRRRNYSNCLGHIMDDPASNKSYDVQLLQEDGGKIPELQEAVQEMQETGSNPNVLKCMTCIMMMQMTAKAGIKKHGQIAVEALFNEFSQLHNLTVFCAQKKNELTKEETKAALRAISLIKEKRCEKIKGRTVADRRPQQKIYFKEDTSSPTVSNDALMMSILIDAKERRDIATSDVAGAYLHAEMKDFTLLKMEGESVIIMCDVSPEYETFACYKNGKKVLYLELLKALYECVQSALLWYELFSGTLKGMGFELNPYDTCIANKTTDKKQYTIAWYVDDTKISHVDDNAVSHVIERIEYCFGEMTVTRGK